MSEQGYLLDGIQTTYTDVRQQGEWWGAKCACGQRWEGIRAGDGSMRESLRFHFTHCPQAQTPNLVREPWPGDLANTTPEDVGSGS